MVKLSIKEAAKHATFLNGRINYLSTLLGLRSNYTVTKEVHLRSKANPEAEDETIVNEVERLFTCKVNDIAHLISKMIEEKLKLALAIDSAKRDLRIDWVENGEKLTLDAAVEFNKRTREFANDRLKNLTTVKATSSKRFDRGYKINVEGNQVQYLYEIEQSVEVDFDKNVVKDLYKKLINRADTISDLVEKAMIEKVVDYEIVYDELDSIEDVIAKYESTLIKE